MDICPCMIGRPDSKPVRPNDNLEGLHVITTNASSKTTARISRRRALKLAAASATLPLVHIRTGRAAGKVTVGFWDHWVPAGNDVMKQQCEAFGKTHQVEGQADFITSTGQ